MFKFRENNCFKLLIGYYLKLAEVYLSDYELDLCMNSMYLWFMLVKKHFTDKTAEMKSVELNLFIDYIYFCLNDYQYNNNITNIVGFDKSLMVDDILAKVPMVNGKLSLIIDDNNNPLTKTRKYNGPVNIRKFHIKILDKFGTIIDLNYMDFSFTLELEILYENFNFKDVFA